MTHGSRDSWGQRGNHYTSKHRHVGAGSGSSRGSSFTGNDGEGGSSNIGNGSGTTVAKSAAVLHLPQLNLVV